MCLLSIESHRKEQQARVHCPITAVSECINRGTMSSKKLSLEERLSLAAKKGKKKSKASKNVNSPSSSKLTSPTPELVTDQPKDIEGKDKDVKTADNGIVIEKEQEETTDEKKNDTSNGAKEDGSKTQANVLPNELSLFKTWLPEGYSELSTNDLLAALKPHIETIMKRSKVHNDSGLMKLVKEKGQTIEEINANLSDLETENNKFRKEVKSLTQKINKLENDNKSLKVDLKDKTNSIKSLKNDLKEKNSTIQDLNESSENASVLQEELRERNDTIESLKDNLSKLELTVNTLNQDIKEERELFTKEKNTIKEATRDQVTTLESKLEQLRIELENATNANKDINSNTTVSNISHNSSTSSFKDSVSWEKQYNVLQEQFNSSKANWNSIEFTLNSRLTDIQGKFEFSDAEVTKLKTQCEEYSMIIQKLETELTTREKTISDDKSRIHTLSSEQNKLQNFLQEVKDDYNLLQKKYTIQKQQLANNISTVKTPKKDEDARSISPLHETHVTRGNSDELDDTNGISGGDNQDHNEIIRTFENEWSLNLPKGTDSSHEPGQRNLSVHEDVEAMSNDMNIPFSSRDNSILNSGNNLDDIPETSSNIDSFFLNKRNSSTSMLNLGRKTSTSQLLNRIPSTSDASGMLMSPTENFGMNNENTITSNNNNQVSAQLVSRLGAEVRRMEGELSSLQAAYDKLKGEKNATNEELLRLMEENEKVKSFQDAKDDLQSRVADLEKQLETALQLLGEKTEHAEELENDVEDLKEMMQQQVQQMIQMQEGMR